MNILFVSTAYKPAWETGGTTRVCHDLAVRLSKTDNNITVFTTTRGEIGNPPVGKSVKVDGVDVYYFKNLSERLASRKIVTPIGSFWKIKTMISNFDIIHIHEHRSLLAAFVTFCARREKIPYIIEGHGSIGRDRGKHSFKLIFDLLAGYRMIKNAAALVAISKHEAFEFETMGADSNNIVRIPNGVEPVQAPINSFPVVDDIVDPNKTTILYLGRLNKIKGIDVLVQSSTLLDDSKFEIVIAGPDDGFKSELDTLITKLGVKEMVSLVGGMYGDQKHRLLDIADVLVLPSRYEVFGSTVFEAGSVSTPVILSDNCAISDELTSEDAALVFHLSAEKLASTIVRLEETKELEQKITTNMSELINTKYSWDRVIDQYLILYQEAVGSDIS